MNPPQSNLRVRKGRAWLKNADGTPLRGAGDLVAIVAEPCAKVIHVDPSKCGCSKRREWLNKKIPFSGNSS